jgi:hypothetical protein
MSDPTTAERIQVQTALTSLAMQVQHATELHTVELGHVKAALLRIEAGQEVSQKRIETLERKTSEGVEHCASHDPKIAHVASDVQKLDQRVEVLEQSTVELKPTAAPESAAMTILKNPATVYAFALVIVTIMAIVMASALSGRDANGLVPGLNSRIPIAAPPAHEGYAP